MVDTTTCVDLLKLRLLQECIPCLLYEWFGFPWNIEEVMQKAAVWEMPLAVGAPYGIFTGPFAEIPQTHSVLFIHWSPWTGPPTSIAPVRIMFPSHSVREWARGRLTSQRVGQEFSKIAHKDLAHLAPPFLEMLKRVNFQEEEVSFMSGQVFSRAVQGEAAMRSLACAPGLHIS